MVSAATLLLAVLYGQVQVSDSLEERLVARAVSTLEVRYDLGTLRTFVLPRAADPGVLGRPDIAILARRVGISPNDRRNLDLMMLSGLLATSLGRVASPYELVGPDCGFGYTTGLSWTDRTMGQQVDPTRRCAWGDWEDHIPKEQPLKDTSWPMKR